MRDITLSIPGSLPGQTIQQRFIEQNGKWYATNANQDYLNLVTDPAQLQAINQQTGLSVTVQSQTAQPTETTAPTAADQNNEPTIYTSADGSLKLIKQSDFDPENPEHTSPDVRIIDDRAQDINPDAGYISYQTSTGSTRYVFFKENGQATIQADSLTEAQSQLVGRDDANDFTYTQYTGIAQGVDNTTNVPDASLPSTSADQLLNSPVFQSLPEDQKQVVQQVYQLIAENNTDQAQQLAAAFKASAEISDPFFKQELMMAVDAIERGFVSIDQEEQYKIQQLQNRRQDLEEDIAARQDFLDLEELSALKSIDREYDQQMNTTRQALAQRGFTSSSRRSEVESLLNETTGDLRESTTRQFGIQRLDATNTLNRGTRDIEAEVERLTQVTQNNKLDFLREAEAKVGTSNLPDLNTNIDPLGNIVGDIPRRQTEDIIRGAQNLMF